MGLSILARRSPVRETIFTENVRLVTPFSALLIKEPKI
jgi:hypothetical protein